MHVYARSLPVRITIPGVYCSTLYTVTTDLLRFKSILCFQSVQWTHFSYDVNSPLYVYIVVYISKLLFVYW